VRKKGGFSGGGRRRKLLKGVLRRGGPTGPGVEIRVQMHRKVDVGSSGGSEGKRLGRGRCKNMSRKFG